MVAVGGWVSVDQAAAADSSGLQCSPHHGCKPLRHVNLIAIFVGVAAPLLEQHAQRRGMRLVVEIPKG